MMWIGSLKVNESNSGKSVVISDAQNNAIRIIKTEKGLLITDAKGNVDIKEKKT